MKTIATVFKPEEAHLLRAHLEGCGIKAYVRDDRTVGMDWAIGMAVGGIKVDVADEDYAEAQEVLGATTIEPDPDVPEAPKNPPGVGQLIRLFLVTAVLAFGAIAVRLDLASRVAGVMSLVGSLAIAAVVTFLCVVYKRRL